MFSFKKKEKLNAPLNVPKHIAVIMDGNGRWAKKGCSRACSVIRLAWKPCKG